MISISKIVPACVLALAAGTAAWGQGQAKAPPTPAQTVRSQFASLSKRLLAMAKDFPESKYDYRPGKDVRSFGEVMVHVASGYAFGARAGSKEQVNWNDWSEIDAKTLAGKSAIVAALEKSIAGAAATLKALPDERFTRALEPWASVNEHAAEHYGQLVAYYRINEMVPPASRPQKK